uniref:RNMT-activating mini protein n=1 Tax=Cyprinus carpio TaxID=7962 RepID=A0A8C2BYX0_CYPCA
VTSAMSCATDYDAQFASRFSAEDAEFQRYRERAPDAPPVVEDWRARRDRRAPEHRQHEHRFPERRHDRNFGAYHQRSRF